MTSNVLSHDDQWAFFEGVDLEYKGGRGGLPRDLWETYSAFANTNGGTIWLGITQREGGLDIHGVPDAEKLVSVLPEAALQALRDHFGSCFDALAPDEVQAVVTAHLEHQVTNHRLQEMLTLHRVDITHMLRSLVDRGFLSPDGIGRGTRYRLPQEVQAPLLSGGAPLLSEQATLLSEQATLLDSLTPLLADDSQQASTPTGLQPRSEEELQEIAAPVRSRERVKPELMRKTILALCARDFLGLQQLAVLLGRRSIKDLQSKHLGPLVREDKLRLRYPDKPNHPDQAYRTVEVQRPDNAL